MSKEITSEMFAYAAGYIDGEGCIRVDRYTIRVEVTACYPGTLRWLADLFGGNFVVKTKATATFRKQYRWSVNGQNSRILLEGILPFSMEKKTQIKLALQFLDTEDKTKKAEINSQLKALKKVIFYEKNIVD